MRHNIFSYSQEVAVKLGLTLPDLLILQWMADFFPTNKVIKHKVGNKIYFWVNYEKLLKDLPILNVSKDRLYRWLKSLTDSHVLEHYTLRNQDGTFSLYRFGDNYEALLGYGDVDESVAPVERGENPKSEKTTKKRSYSEVFDAEENEYIKEALSKWLKVCKDRGVKFNIRTVKKWAETLRTEAKENSAVALKIVDQSVENAWNNLYSLKNNADSKVVSTIYDPANLARDEQGNLKVF